MFYTYVLFGSNKKLYTGSTDDLQRRLLEHNRGLVESTKRYRPLKLIYYEACLSLKGARLRERQLKTGFGRAYLNKRLKCANSSAGPARIATQSVAGVVERLPSNLVKAS